MKELRGAEVLALVRDRPAGVPPVVFLDVREPWEAALAAIDVAAARSLLIPMQSVPARLADLDPAQPVICICHHGTRSAQVVAFLERMGFESAYNLAGGIDAWSREIDASVPRY